MPIAVKFEKPRAQYYLDCLANGQAIAPIEDGWTGNDMLALAGACFFGALSQGPASFWLKEVPEDKHPEYKEADDESFDNDLHAAIAFYAQLTMLVAHREFDDSYAPNVMVLVTQEGDVKRTLQTVKGVKGHSDRI
ncbi:MAG: hypothetical protein IH999_09840 [Proteobacteria bacterium]|nr:hypothetical protein [Pseudomonadota bacterium]